MYSWTKAEYIDFLNKKLADGTIGKGQYEQEMICIGER